MTTRDIFPNHPETCIHCGGGSDPETPGRCDWCFGDDGRSVYLNCAVCDGPIVFDDTTARLYCETNSDHELVEKEYEPASLTVGERWRRRLEAGR